MLRPSPSFALLRQSVPLRLLFVFIILLALWAAIAWAVALS